MSRYAGRGVSPAAFTRQPPRRTSVDIEQADVVRLPPKARYTVPMRIRDVRKGVLSVVDDEDDGGGACSVCGYPVQLVRPGKYQCPHCELNEMLDGAIREIRRLEAALSLQIDERAVARLRQERDRAVVEADRLRAAVIEAEHELQQVLGRALGYPWYKDDPENFPGATEADGVCPGDHTGASLAAEAAARLAKVEAERDTLRDRLTEYERPEKWPEGSQMRHVQDLVHALNIAKRREQAAESERDAALDRLARLERALAWYANPDTYVQRQHLDHDGGQRAREALEGKGGACV